MYECFVLLYTLHIYFNWCVTSWNNNYVQWSHNCRMSGTRLYQTRI